jgi:hypothetical protein
VRGKIRKNMPTDFRDTTGGRKGEVWAGFGIRCILKQVLTGTVCSPLGSEFGCGSDREIGVEKEQSLGLKLGGGKEGVGMAEIRIGTKTTKSEKWTAKSERCEWCKPEVYFPDSRIETWTLFHRVDDLLSRLRQDLFLPRSLRVNLELTVRKIEKSASARSFRLWPQRRVRARRVEFHSTWCY